MSVNARTNADLAAAIGLAAVFPFIEYLVPVAALRVPLGLCIMLVIPGYLLVLALFPGRDDLKNPERLGFVFGLSFIVVSFIGLGFDYTPVGITRYSFLISFTGFCILVGLVALYRRRRLSVEDRFVPHFRVRGVQWHRMAWPDRILVTVSTLAVILVAGGVITAVLMPRTGERFTEFYVLQADGQLAGHSSQVDRGQPITVNLGVVNREHEDVLYRIARESDAGEEQVADLQLGHEETWEQSHTFALKDQGENQRVTFLLYKGDEQSPHRTLHLWFTVKDH